MSKISEITFLIETGRTKLAQKKLKELIVQNIKDEKLYYLLAYTYYLESNISNAITTIKQALKINPNYVDAILLLARTQVELNDFYRAKTLIDKATKLNPENEDIFFLKASIAAEKGNLKKAEIFINKSLEISPEDTDLINFKINILIIKNKLKEAGKSIKEVLAIDPNQELSFFYKGLILLSNGKLKEAKECFLESLRINPNNEAALLGLKATIQSKNPLFWFSTKIEFFLARNRKAAGLLINILWKVISIISILIYSVTKEIDYLVLPALGFLSSILLILRTPSLISTILLRLDKIGKELVSNMELLLKITTILLIGISPLIIYSSPNIYEDPMTILAVIFIIIIMSVMIQDILIFKTNSKKMLGLFYVIIIGLAGFFYVNMDEEPIKELMGFLLLISSVVYPLIFEFMIMDEKVPSA